ncbi:hypothetical protein GOBAR_AA34677 [Gossypium barbadense]|uniref:Uncharacterized protein n=1 Tax=Gossypium barbadense TaxID=3634 RepID=A0A2P5W4I9_GOSBA|nr:hypothetical protein GOBAR_AA34677 [Gossypium barbadense]
MEVLYDINEPLRSEDIDIPLTNVRPVKKVALVIVAGSTASSAVYFGTCEFGKSFLSKLEDYPTLLIPPTTVAMGNIISSAISLTTPLDVVKTRLMTQVHGGNKVAAVMYSGVNALVKQILKEEGWIGLTSRVVHSACFSALSYSASETARLAILHPYLKNKEELSKISVAPARVTISW